MPYIQPVPSHFNSRPHGGRLFVRIQAPQPLEFQLTPSRRATTAHFLCLIHAYISTHALTEGDQGNTSVFHAGRHFNSRPHGGRQQKSAPCRRFCHFNSRPHGGRRFFLFSSASTARISTHALTEGDWTFYDNGLFLEISTHSLTEGAIKFIPSRKHFFISTHALTEGDDMWTIWSYLIL